MKIFDFQCPKCKIIKEVFIFKDYDYNVDCDTCKMPMKMMLSAPAIILDDSFPGAAIKRGK